MGDSPVKDFSAAYQNGTMDYQTHTSRINKKSAFLRTFLFVTISNFSHQTNLLVNHGIPCLP